MKYKIVLSSALMVMVACMVVRFMYPSPFAATWDEVDFALALDEYDLVTMQPHFPGYPFFILGGMAVHIFIQSPTEALANFNTIMVASMMFPVYALARRRMDLTAALLTTMVLQTGSYLSILATQPMSEGTAIALLWWYLWSLDRAFQKSSLRYQVFPLAIFALLMGVRLSYAPFGLGLLALWGHDWKRNRTRVLPLVGIAVMLQCSWLVALIWNVGGIDGFIKLAFGFVGGHFTEWGGAITETSEPVWSRLYRLVVHNVLWSGLFAHSILLMSIFLVLLLLLVVQWKGVLLRKVLEEEKWLLLVTGAYFFWNAFAQNIDKPRHSYPLAILALFILLRLLLQCKHIIPVLLIFAGAQLFIGAALVKEQATHLPATYQLADYLEQQDNQIVYTWEETRIMEYLAVSYQHKRYYQYAYFLQDKKHRRNDTIYVTNHLLEGFRSQGESIDDNVEKIKEFRSNPLFDPVYSRIVLYKWLDK